VILTWESVVPILITVGAGLLLWILKIAINAVGKSITQKLQEKIDKLESEIEKLESEKLSLEKRIDYNNERIDFLIETLIKRNS
jgi:chaperonin cofactor prefoldin